MLTSPRSFSWHLLSGGDEKIWGLQWRISEKSVENY